MVQILSRYNVPSPCVSMILTCDLCSELSSRCQETVNVHRNARHGLKWNRAVLRTSVENDSGLPETWSSDMVRPSLAWTGFS